MADSREIQILCSGLSHALNQKHDHPYYWPRNLCIVNHSNRSYFRCFRLSFRRVSLLFFLVLHFFWFGLVCVLRWPDPPPKYWYTRCSWLFQVLLLPNFYQINFDLFYQIWLIFWLFSIKYFYFFDSDASWFIKQFRSLFFNPPPWVRVSIESWPRISRNGFPLSMSVCLAYLLLKFTHCGFEINHICDSRESS